MSKTEEGPYTKERLRQRTGLNMNRLDMLKPLGLGRPGRQDPESRRPAAWVFQPSDELKALAMFALWADVEFEKDEITSIFSKVSVKALRREFTTRSFPEFLEFLRAQGVKVRPTPWLNKFLQD